MNFINKIKKQINSRERVRLALQHKEPDRVPLDFGAAGSTGIMGEPYQDLRNYLKLPKKPSKMYSKVWDAMQQLVLIDEDLLILIGADARRVHINPPSKWKLKIRKEGAYYKYTDEWGVGWQMPLKSGHYFDMFINPLRDVQSVNEIEKYNWPIGSDPARIEGIPEAARELYEKTEAAITIGGMCAGMLDMASWLFGMEQCMINFITNVKIIDAVMEKVTDIKCAYWEMVLPKVKGCVDMVMICDDLGSQDALLISPEMYRKHIKPLHTRLLNTIHKNIDVPVYFHCDGSILEILPDLIESGINVLNPIQASAANMDTKILKKRFGKDVCFWGGGCDSQKILPYGSVQEVRDEVKHRIEDLAPGGGFVFSQVHNIQIGVPPENIVAMWETFRKYADY